MMLAATAGLAAVVPDASRAEQSAARRVPLLDANPVRLNPGSLRIGLRHTAGSPSESSVPGGSDACGARCFSLSPAVANSFPAQSAYALRDFSLNLAESGPVSLQFNGRRLKMRVSF